VLARAPHEGMRPTEDGQRLYAM